jgi:hypothetical protein
MVTLVRYVKSLCPAQAIDEYTPDAWLDVLGDLPAGECRAAVVEVVKRERFVAPADIIAEIKRTRAKRAEHARSARVLGPARATREALDDPRPLRESIRAILSRHGRPELTP